MIVEPELFLLMFMAISSIALVILVACRRKYGTAILMPAEPLTPVTAGNHADPVKSPAFHMARLEDIVMAASETARHAERFHYAAHQQIDAANYAIQNLLDELSAVMTVTGHALPHRSSPSRVVRTQNRPRYQDALAA